MGGVPAKRNSKSKVNRRRSQQFLKKVKLGACPECHSPMVGHRACPKCGKYTKQKKSVKSAT